MPLQTIYKALSDESRLRILHMLSLGPFNVQEITQLLGSSQPTVSHHLKVLATAGLVEAHKEGTWIYYSPAKEDSSSAAPTIASNFLTLVRRNATSEDTNKFKKDVRSINAVIAKRRDRSRHFFDSVAPQWRTLSAQTKGTLPGDAPYLELLAAKIPADKTLLELGCGSGTLLEKILPRSGKTIGVDYSPAMLDEARGTLGKNASNVDLRLGHLEHLPVEDNSIDLAVACMVFHHVAVMSEALRDIYRVLHQGGRLEIVDLLPHNEEYMRDRFADLWLGLDPKELRRSLEESGFAVLSLDVIGEKKDVFMLSAEKKGGSKI